MSIQLTISDYENYKNKISQLCDKLNYDVSDIFNIIEEPFKNNKLKIGFLGKIKTGKTTLMNCLLGNDILPAKVLPTTAAVTIIEYSENKNFSYELTSGEKITEEFNLERVRDVVEGKKNVDEEKISVVNINLPHRLGSNVTLVDTPGLDDIAEWRVARTISILKEVDVAIMLLKHPITGTTLEFIKTYLVTNDFKKIIFCLTFIDRLDSESDLNKVIKNIEDEISKITNVTPMLVPLSPKDALNSFTEGEHINYSYLDFESKLIEFLKSTDRQQLILKRCFYNLINLLEDFKINATSHLGFWDKSIDEKTTFIEGLKIKIEDIRDKFLTLSEKTNLKIDDIQDDIKESLEELRQSIIQDVELEVIGFSGNDFKHLAEARIPAIFKNKIAVWETSNRSIIQNYLRMIDDFSKKGIEQLLGIKEVISSEMILYTQQNTGLQRIQTVAPISMELFKTEYNSKSEDVKMMINMGSVAVAFLTGNFLIAFLPTLFDQLFGFSERRTEREKENLKPQLIQTANNTLLQYQDKVLFEIDTYRKRIIDEINLEIEKEIYKIEDNIKYEICNKDEIINKKNADEDNINIILEEACNLQNDILTLISC